MQDFDSVMKEVIGTLNSDDRETSGLSVMCQQTMPIDFIVMFGIAGV
jgi:hypothetical protein